MTRSRNPETTLRERQKSRRNGEGSFGFRQQCRPVSCVGFLLVMRCVPARGQHLEYTDTGQVTAIKFTMRLYGGDKTTPEQTKTDVYRHSFLSVTEVQYPMKHTRLP